MGIPDSGAGPIARPGRFLAACPALQGCYTEGEIEEEARELIRDAIRLHVEDRLATGEPMPAIPPGRGR